MCMRGSVPSLYVYLPVLFMIVLTFYEAPKALRYDASLSLIQFTVYTGSYISK